MYNNLNTYNQSPQDSIEYEHVYRQLKVISIRDNTGKYANAEGGWLFTNRDAVGPWESFTLIPIVWESGNKYALRAANNNFVSADYGSGGGLVANRIWIGPQEQFTFQPVNIGGQRKFVIISSNGKYVSADHNKNNQLIADRNAVGPWEQFDIYGL
ncbi:fascin domain-containing protein [Bacillus cereus group sp. MYBK217-2]|uniref:fascin domain-containing protein n=1 Tax=Bacillus cereus group sp. MYBK217-2 TaxID=3450661 RepID=UPI003F7AFFD0